MKTTQAKTTQATVSHAEACRLLQADAVERLDPAERAGLDAHLHACAACQAYAAELAALQDSLRRTFAHRWDGARGPRPDLAQRVAGVQRQAQHQAPRLRLWPNLAGALTTLLLVAAIAFVLQVQSRQPVAGTPRDSMPTAEAVTTTEATTALTLPSTTMAPEPTSPPEPAPTQAPARPVAPPFAHTVEAEFPGLGTLAGYSIYDVESVTLNIVTIWYASTAPTEDFYILAHLEDGSGQQWSQTTTPVYRYQPTSQWPAGAFAQADVWLDLPYDLPAGDYTISISVSEIDSGAAVPATTGDLSGDGRVRLGTVRLLLTEPMASAPPEGAPTPVLCHGFCPGENWTPISPPILTYTIMPGDTCSRIAAAYAVMVEALLAANGLDTCEGLSVGQVLTIPYTAVDVPPPICPVTRPPEPPFVPPAPYNHLPVYDGTFWYGTAELWTRLNANGASYGLPHDGHGFGDKLFWWHQGFDWRTELEWDFSVSTTRLDVPGESHVSDWAYGSYAPDTLSFINTGLSVPTAGCWQVTGEYNGEDGRHSLSFVIWVSPAQAQ